MSSYIEKLPNHILKAIFCLLPVTNLIECRYVCKSWQRILSHPDFSNLDLPKRKPTSLFLCRKGEDNLYWLELEGDQSLHFTVAANIKHFSSESGRIEISNSCNGLICVCQGTDSMNIINPITSECINLLLHDTSRRLCRELCGIGFDQKTNQFKLIRFSFPIFNEDMQYLRAELCTLGKDGIAWRSIAGLPPQLKKIDFWNNSCRPFCNGSLHYCLSADLYYYCGASRREDYICAFDFHTEKFTSLTLPSPDYGWSEPRNIGVYKDSYLTFASCSSDMVASCSSDMVEFQGFSYFDWKTGGVRLWIMKEYGIAESWSQIFFLRSTLNISEMQLLQNGHLLICELLRDMHLYNPATERYTDLKIESRLHPILHNPSFTSLKDVVGVSSRLSTRQRDIKKKIIKTMISNFLFRDLRRAIKFIMALLVVLQGTVIFESRLIFCGDGIVCGIAFGVTFFVVVAIVNWMDLTA